MKALKPAKVLLLLAAGSASAEAASEPLSSSKPWVLEYADTQCAAGREFGPPTQPIRLLIRPSANGQTYELLVHQDQSAPEFAEQSKGTVDFGSGNHVIWAMRYGAKGKKTSVHQFRMPAAIMQEARTAQFVTLSPRKGPSFSFRLSSMPALLHGLEKCIEDLQRHWNMTPKESERIAVSSTGDVRRLFTNKDYPEEAQRRWQEGTAQFLLLIDEAGRVAGCDVIAASGIPLFDVMGCQVIRERAKFTPARDSNGKPIRNSYVTPPVVWKMRG